MRFNHPPRPSSISSITPLHKFSLELNFILKKELFHKLRDFFFQQKCVYLEIVPFNSLYLFTTYFTPLSYFITFCESNENIFHFSLFFSFFFSFSRFISSIPFLLKWFSFNFSILLSFFFPSFIIPSLTHFHSLVYNDS